MMATNRILFVISTMLLTGCASEPFGYGNRIGTLYVDGPNVFLNGQRAERPMKVSDGDKVTTGEDSSALVRFVDDGFFQLDENTDPIFIIDRLREAGCLLIKLATGQAYVESKGLCRDVETGDMRAAINSNVNILIKPELTEITVLEGMVTVRGEKIVASQRGTISRRDVKPRIETLSEEALKATVAWRDEYDFPREAWEPPYIEHDTIERPGRTDRERTDRPGTDRPGTDRPGTSDRGSP